MPLELTLVAVILASALIHAAWNALVKTGGDEALMMALMTAVTGVIALIGVTLTDAPDVRSWPFIATSVFIHAAYIVLLVKSYQAGELSHVYPLARGAARLLVALGAFAFAAERITPVGGLGVLLISAGVMSLALAGGGRSIDGRKAAALGLLTGVSIAAYTVVDGLGIRASGTPLGYIA
jgi:multidrug transporter EmrE-like cation transporter